MKLLLRLVTDALPSAINRFKRFKTRRLIKAPTEKLKKPSKYFIRNLLSLIWWIAPLTILGLTWLIGLFNPLRLDLIDQTIVALAIASSFLSIIFLRARRPLVLSTDELSLMVGMPTAVGRLPVELGSIPPSRRRFPEHRLRQP